MNKYILIIASSILFMSCGNNQNSKNENEQEADQKNDASEIKNPALQSFSDLPEEIDGCSCLISENSTAFRKNEYIYVDNLQNLGFVQIDGEMIKLSLDEVENDSEMEIIAKGSNGEIDIKLDLRKSDKLDYVGSYFGTLEVTPKNGKKITKSVFGECGC